MINPLTLEERVDVTHLIGHDIANLQNTLFLNIYNSIEESSKPDMNKIDPKFRHLRYVLLSITSLATNNDCFVRDSKPANIELELKQLTSVLGDDRVSYSIEIVKTFKSNLPVLYTALYNLTKNALRLVDPEEGKVDINVSQFAGVIKNPTYTSERSPEYGEFIRFNVHDNGPGFPADKPLKEWLEFGTTTGGSSRTGFGLYYVTLVSKFLRSPLVIDSKKGDTNISLYHTINLK